MNTLQSQWESFAKVGLPGGCSAIQRQEVRRAFYAGAAGALSLLTGMADDVSEDAGAMMIEGWVEETRLFAKELLAGRA